MTMAKVREYLKNSIKKSELLANIQIDAQKAGMNAITDQEIEAELSAYRQGKR
jgi:hypothetical protein